MSEDDDSDDDFAEDKFADDVATIDCPHCGKEIYEDAERCPHCERYLSDEDAPPGRKSWLIVIGAVLCMLIVYYWIVH